MPLPERELIAAIRRAARSGGHGIVRGIGDDCAVLRLPTGHEALITTDFTLEGVHFRREWHPPESVGHRCLTRGLSDIAAMGGNPIAAFLSLALPSDLPQSWVDGFLRGFIRLARKFGVQLAGGDTAQSLPLAPAISQAKKSRRQSGKSTPGAPILADVIVLGSVLRGKALLRSGARVGDDIFVTGTLGGASAVLHRLMRNAGSASNRSVGVRSGKSGAFATSASGSMLERAHFFPAPRLAVGRWLRERQLPSAMIDISDGLSTDLSHIGEESDVGAWIAEVAVPIARGATLEEALHGGDDYQLLFTAPASKHNRMPDRIAGVPIRWIGTITKRRGLWLVAPDMKSRQKLQVRGWQHFTT